MALHGGMTADFGTIYEDVTHTVDVTVPGVSRSRAGEVAHVRLEIQGQPEPDFARLHPGLLVEGYVRGADTVTVRVRWAGPGCITPPVLCVRVEVPSPTPTDKYSVTLDLFAERLREGCAPENCDVARQTASRSCRYHRALEMYEAIEEELLRG